ncbi:hypothetical protein SO802_032768 [Lithocarpus litseifolius]|uniref:Uncharacterized protein n=1 Tax=Lithocarpus litseifolius TaxID=425828 RepID=A0AAW2BCI1_9ROSI
MPVNLLLFSASEKVLTVSHCRIRSEVFHELSALVLNILRSPLTPILFSDDSPALMTTTRLAAALALRRSSTEASMAQITPARFASLMLGILFALMLCGSAPLRDREGEEIFRPESRTSGAEPLRIGLSQDAKYTKSGAVGIPSLPLDLSVS